MRCYHRSNNTRSVPHGQTGSAPGNALNRLPIRIGRSFPPRAHRRPAVSSKGASGVLFGETETPRFIDAVRKIKEEQRKTDRKTREAKEKVKLARRKSAER